MITRSFLIFLSVLAVMVTACEKNIQGRAAQQSLYSESILYLKPGTTDHIVYPILKKRGTYSSFPFGLSLDEQTGAINVSKSETGLRYLVFFDGEDGCTDSTSIVISGINYPDHYYHLAKGDSTAYPLYNATFTGALPGSSFDVSQEASTHGLQLVPATGTINLAASVRNGIFGAEPVNYSKKDIPITYRLNDASGKALNTITVRFYYFTTAKEIPDYLRALLAEREAAYNLMTAARSFPKKVKPRPPCVIIIAH